MRKSIDFASDTLADGRRFRMLYVVDDFSRECLALVADTSLSGKRVARKLDAVGTRRGLTLTLVSDNGTELTDAAILGWSQQHKVGWQHCARQAAAERIRGKLHRPIAGRMPERDPVHVTSACPGRDVSQTTPKR
jgi:putative transposase